MATRELQFGFGRKLPIIVASESAECGLACLAMIVSYHGRRVDLNGLRQQFSLSMRGVSLRTLIGFADHLGLSSRPVRVELEELSRVSTPAVLHWEMSHFVVLERIRGGRLIIHDPGRGRLEMKLEEAGRYFTGVAVEFTPAPAFERRDERIPFKISSLWGKFHGGWGAAAQVLALSVALQLLALAAPFQVQLVIDEAVGRSDRALLTVLALGFGAVLLLQVLVEGLRNWVLQVFGGLLTFQLVGNLVRHLLRARADFFEKRHVADILSRVASTQAIQDCLTQSVAAVLIDGVMASLAAVALFIYAPELAWIVLGTLSLHFMVSAALFQPMRNATEAQLSASADERGHLMESIRAATTIKLLGREAEREAGWRNLYADEINAAVRVGRVQIAQASVKNALMGLQTIAVLYFGARTVLDGAGLSIGMLMAFLAFRQTFTDRMLSLVDEVQKFRLLGLHLQRLGDIAQADADPCEALPAQNAFEGEYELRDVSFRYGNGDPFVLEKISLSIKAGEMVAITGPSGGGKTTLLKLLLGLQEPTSGILKLDGRTASRELWRSWRKDIGVVAQDDQLLSGTIADNIAFFDAELDMERVIRAAKAARVHEDIAKLPMQYLSLVGDMGSALSGGQRQRVLLARALYRDPKVLVLDEGTANLDETTENAIADMIGALSITRIVVAHRPALIKRAQRVFVVEDCGLRERQRPAKLMPERHPI